ncbi:Golgi-associated RAB2 interactor protein 5B-like isoform X4 [Monodelphis domestica]|uniref:Golgi-associated RAB2 interactor protein 5B-like isoform X4 n=2 Tax=Monodelphis domestica TaxID=13616 RepID=UPI0024E24B58|nr:Golgi-associated RAB2 interactor protein 5B-like isoform X4 [Monodelphis domestica]
MEIMLGQRHLRESNSLWPGSPESLYRGPWWLLEVPLKRQRGPGEAATASSYSPAQRLQSFPQSPCLECGLPVLPSPELAEQRALGFGSELCRKGPGAPPETGPNFRVAPPHPLCVQGLERTFLRGAAPFFLVLPCMGPGECCQLAPPDPPDPCMRSQRGPPGCVTPARLPLLSSAVPESHSQSALPAESILALLQQPPPPPPQSPDLQAHRDSLSPMKPRKPSPVVLPGELHLPEVEAELSFPLCFPKPGPLQRAVAEGNYPPLGPFTAMFESDFLQVTNKGEPVFLHKKENPVTMAVASSFPGLLLPDLVLLARPVQSKKQPPRLELTRLLPAQLVRLFVHSEAGWRLKLRLASGRSFYLRLVAEPAEGCLLFNRWRFLIFLMQGPIPAWARSPDEQAAQDESAPMSAAGEKTLLLPPAPAPPPGSGFLRPFWSLHRGPPQTEGGGLPSPVPRPEDQGEPGLDLGQSTALPWAALPTDGPAERPGPPGSDVESGSRPHVLPVPAEAPSQERRAAEEEHPGEPSGSGRLPHQRRRPLQGPPGHPPKSTPRSRALPTSCRSPKSSRSPRSSPKSSRSPRSSPKSSRSPRSSPKTSRSPRSSPKTSRSPKSSPKTSRSPRSSPKTSRSPRSSPKTSRSPRSSPKSSRSPRSSPKTSRSPRSSPKSSRSPKSSPKTSRSPRSSPKSSRSPRSSPKTSCSPRSSPKTSCSRSPKRAPKRGAIPRGTTTTQNTTTTIQNGSSSPKSSHSPEGCANARACRSRHCGLRFGKP